MVQIFSPHCPFASGVNTEHCTVRLLNTAFGGSLIDISCAVERSSVTLLAPVPSLLGPSRRLRGIYKALCCQDFAVNPSLTSCFIDGCRVLSDIRVHAGRLLGAGALNPGDSCSATKLKLVQFSVSFVLL